MSVEHWLTGAISLTLLSIAWEDFRWRTVYLWQLLLLGALMATLGHFRFPVMLQLRYTALNLGFLGIQLALAYFFLNRTMKKRGIRWLDGAIGAGDLLLLPVLTPAFSPGIFLPVYTAGLVLLLAGVLAWNRWSSRPETQVPLAGGLALCWCVWLMFEPYCSPPF